MADSSSHTVFGVQIADPFHRLLALLVGAFLITAFYGLDETATTMRYSVLGSARASSPGESYFWLAHGLFITPGACLVGWGLAPWLASLLQNLVRRLESLSARGRLIVFAGFGVAAALVYRLARAVYLHDFPVSPSELSAQFGGRILADGHLRMEAPPLYEYMPRAFDWFDGSRVASSEWPGVSFFAMLGELGLSPWLHLLMAAVPLVALGWFCARRWSVQWGLLAAGIFFVSPLSFVISMTEHPHLLSRAFVALAIVFLGIGTTALDRADGSPEEKPKKKPEKPKPDNSPTDEGRGTAEFARWPWVAAGLALGAGLTCRPVAVLLVCTPLLISVLLRASKSPDARAACMWTAAGAVAPLVLFAIYNQVVTGNPVLPPRWGPNAGESLMSGYEASAGLDGLWSRMGDNVGYSLLTLAVWFLGPLGLLLIGLGVTVDRFSRLLAIGVAATLGLALLQPVSRAHHLGPLQFTELVPLLTLLAVFGCRRLKSWLSAIDVQFRSVASVLVCALVLIGSTFNSWHGNMLDRSSNTGFLVHGFMAQAAAETPPAVVLVPDFVSLWQRFPQFQQYGTWVLQWRPNLPDGSGHFVLLLDEPGLAERAAQAYPDRPILRLEHVEGEGLMLVPAL